jgi:hypothetical protein
MVREDRNTIHKILDQDQPLVSGTGLPQFFDVGRRQDVYDLVEARFSHLALPGRVRV